MNHVLLTDRELAAVVRVLDEPHFSMSQIFRQRIQHKFRVARSRGRRVKPPRPVENVVAVFNQDQECVSLIVDPGDVKGLPGWTAVMGVWVPNDPPESDKMTTRK